MKAVNRIKKNEDFGLAINKGNSTRLPSYIIHVLKTNTGFTRVGISTSKKLGHAVIRNRIRRQVRAICDEVIDYNKQSLDIVIIVRRKFLETSFNDNKSLLSDYMKGL